MSALAMSSASISAGTVRNLLRQGGAAFSRAQHDAALAAYESALVLEPNNEGALFGAASCLHALGSLDRAADLFGRLADAHPQKAMYRYNQGYSLLHDAQYDAAARVLDECRRRIDDPHVKANLAIALQYATKRDLESAASLLEQAATALPDDHDVQRNLGLLRLLKGEYEAGWRLHERRATLLSAVNSTAAPLWRGDSLAGRTLLLWHEQGLGDSLQFVRYLPLVAARAQAEGGTVVFQPPRQLYRLFACSFASLAPCLTVLPQEQPVVAFDAHCSLLSLPERMRTTLATIPVDIPYLRADPEVAARWQQHLGAERRLKVGLVWASDARSGSTANARQAYARRSLTLEQLRPLLGIAGILYCSLQKGEPAEQAQAMAGRDNFVDLTAGIADFADTAALAAQLDLVITVDTSVCHLAGGMGLETWLLNRRDACWRWLVGRDDSPWYPTLTQYRQSGQGEWGDVVARVTHDLKARVAGRG